MPPLTPPTPKRRRFPGNRLTFLLVIIVLYVAVALVRPLPALTPDRFSGDLTLATTPANFPWPGYGQSAVGLVGGGVVATHGSQVPVPTASLAKTITALTVLKKYPLSGGQSGPTITLGATDIAYYQHYVHEDGSVLPVTSGEQLSERQIMEGMLLHSANNLADSLATWAFGSLGAYQRAANAYVKSAGLDNTTVGTDASGFLPNTTSTAGDLVKLGSLVMQNSVLAGIVGQKSAVLPYDGLVLNRNHLLGKDGVVGIKTGNNDQDLGAFLGAADTTVRGKPATVLVAVLDAPNLPSAQNAAATLLQAARSDVTTSTLVSRGEVLGTYQQPWGASLQAVANKSLSITTLRGASAKASLHLNAITTSAQAGQPVGNLTAPASTYSPPQTIPITLKQAPTEPSLGYRLLHP